MTALTSKLAEVKKAVVAACGVLATCLAAGVLTGTQAQVASAILAVATVLGVYTATNKPAA